VGHPVIEFTNRRGYKTSFYRGHGKFDNVVFEVIPPPTKETSCCDSTGSNLWQAGSAESVPAECPNGVGL
jgi:hypothetical protein